MAYSAQPDSFVRDRLPAQQDMPLLMLDAPGLQFPDRINLVQELFDRALRGGFGAHLMLRSDRLSLSYAQASAQVNCLAQVLVQDCGLIPGNRVLLRGGNSIAMALAWLAVVKAGMVAVATMPMLRAKELGEVISKARPALALCDAALLQELQLARAQSPEPLAILCFNARAAAVTTSDADGAAVAEQADEAATLEALAAAKQAVFSACPTAATDIALLAFTSGTTGKPKAAAHTHRDLLAACETWPHHVLRATPHDIVMGSPPLAFTFGLGGLLVFPMWAKASVYYPDISYTPQAMAELMYSSGATICYTAPTFYRQMAPFMRALRAERGPPPLRICVSAGEGLADATRQLWKDASGIEMLDGIGATEMFHIFISSTPQEVRRGAIGKVVPGYVAKVVDDNGSELPRGTVGKLAVVGPTGCKYMDDQRQCVYVRAGWNYPGDAFFQDTDGYFFYQARTDDMIITSGYNVGAPEVEDALLSHPAVAECAVIGKADDQRGMLVKAFCVLRPGYAGDAAMVSSLQEHVKAAIAPYKYPREIDFLDRLPRTETGKLQRFKLKSA